MTIRVLITGGAGFIGSNLAINLKRDYPSYEVICMDNLKRDGSELNVPRLKNAGVKFVKGDIRNIEDLETVGKFDWMIECAAECSVLAGLEDSPYYVINSNLMGTVNCLEQVRKYKAGLIFLSSSRIYPLNKINKLTLSEKETRFEPDANQNVQGVSDKGLTEDFPLEGIRTLYGATKLCSEILIKEYVELYKIKAVVNRCGVIAGPWQFGKVDQGFVSLWVKNHINKQPLSFIGFGGQGKQIRDVLHVDDLYDAVKLEIENIDKINGEIFNIGGGKENSVSLIELTQKCENITGNKIKITPVPETRYGDIHHYITDYSKFNNALGWKPKRDIDKILKDTSAWLLEGENFWLDYEFLRFS